MIAWQMWKKGFDAWENATAKYVETMMKSPLVLGPAGAMLTATMKAKSAYDKRLATWWGAMGVATKRDQERALHSLHQLESKMIDLEDALDDLLANAKKTKE